MRALNKKNINWFNHSAIVRGKGEKEREVFFIIRCNIWLKRYIEGRNDHGTAMFVTERLLYQM
ncbi:hypothetical protein [Bacillus sp. FJAT-49736]|uniref:hypothetical protein n=1 Tax=Bacillus sp. FJAT-49736 TaxID=2833582 RepID=UPI001BC94DE6|nr:hypothetical protein [Bacillus sp. FJAT-49736]